MAPDSQSPTSVLLFGGKATTGPTGETWRWAGGIWTKLNPATAPSARWGATLVHDPVRHQDVLFGGADATGPLNDTWTWNGSTWTKLAPAATPPARSDAAAVWDPTRGVVMMFGGSAKSTKLQDTWLWNGSTWSQASPSAKPAARSGAALAFDPSTGSAVLFGGATKTAVLGDTWRWNGTTWAQLAPATSPTARSGARMAVGPVTGQMILFGGLTATAESNETWLYSATTWTKLAPAQAPSARDSFGFVAGADGGLLLAGGGSGTGGATPTGGTWIWQTPPGASLSVTASGQSRQATVTWTAPLSGGSPITSYTVTASPGGATTTSTSLSATVTGLQAATAYTFTVVATNALGTGSASAASNVATTWALPGVPRSVTAVPDDSQATVSWQAPSSDGGASISSYVITPYANGAALPSSSVNGTTLSTTVRGLHNGTPYTFGVAAVTVVGTGSQASSSSCTPASLPGAPQTVTAVAGDSRVTVSWQPPLSDGGSPITAYTVTPYLGTIAQAPTVVAAGSSSVTITELNRAAAYTVTVSATNALGTGPVATSGTVTTWDVPHAPRSVTAAPSNAQATVTWQAPDSDGGTAVTRYTVTALAGSTAVSTVAVDGDKYTAIVPGLTNGTPYTLSVAAANAVGTGPSATTAATPDNRPSVPLNVAAASTSPNSVTVTWEPPQFDGGSPVTGYRLTPYRGASALTPVTATAGTTSYTYPGLAASTAYTFVVAALNNNGAGASAAPVAVTTLAVVCPVPAATDVWTGAVDGASWTTAGNWSAGRVPDDGDFACLPAGAAGTGAIAVPATTLRRLVSYRPLTIVSGLTSTEAVDLEADATWSGGALRTASLTVGPMTTLTVDGQVTLAGSVTVVNNGTVRLASGGNAPTVSSCGTGGTASWTNTGTLAFGGTAGGAVYWCGSFTNTGAVTNTGSGQGALSVATPQFTNTGTITASAGILVVYSGALNGGTLGGGAGQVVLDGPMTTTSSVAFADNVWLVGALSGTTVVQPGATLHVGFDPSYQGGSFSAGTIAGTVTGAGTLSVAGHEFSGPGTTFDSVASVAADLRIAHVLLGDYVRLVPKADSTATVIDTSTAVQITGTLTVGDSTSIVNYGTVTVDASTNQTVVSSCNAGNSASWLNAGSLVFDGRWVGSFYWCGSFTDTGTVRNVGTGRGVLSATSPGLRVTGTGTLDAQAGTLVVYSGALVAGSVGGGAGHVVLDGPVTTTPSVRLGNGVWVIGTLSGTIAIPAGTTLNVGYDPSYVVEPRTAGTVSGLITGQGTLVAGGREFNQPGNTFYGIATIAADLDGPTVVLGDYTSLAVKPDQTPTVIGADTTLRIAGAVTLAGPVAVVNNGTTDITVGAHAGPNGGIQSCGTGSVVSWTNTGTLNFSAPTGAARVALCGSFTNTGLVEHTGPGSDLLIADQLSSTGKVTAQDGVLAVYSGSLTGGDIGGGAGQVVLDGPITATDSVRIGDNVWAVGNLSGSIAVSAGAVLHAGYDPAYPTASLPGTVTGQVTGPGTLDVIGHEFSYPGQVFDRIAAVSADLDIAAVTMGQYTRLGVKPDGTAIHIGASSTLTLAATPALAPGLALVNDGTVDFRANGYFTCGDCSFTNEPDGSIRLYNPDGAFTHGFAVDNGTFDNRGIIHVTGFLPGTWIWFGPHVALPGGGAGKAEVDSLSQPTWIQNLVSDAGPGPFARALTQGGLSGLASNTLMAAAARLSGAGVGRCVDVNASLGVLGASTGVCTVEDPSGAEAVVLTVSGGAGLPVEGGSFNVADLLAGEPSVSLDAGAQVLWTDRPGGGRGFAIGDLDGLSWCQSGAIVPEVVGVTGQSCWGPADGVPFQLGMVFPRSAPGSHSMYLGAMVGTPQASLGASLSYSVSIGCGRWYSLTLQMCAPANTTPPSIPGNAAIGATMTAQPGTWNPGSTDPTFALSYHYQWERCTSPDPGSCSSIGGANSPPYVPTGSDNGDWIAVQVTTSNANASSPPILAGPVGPVT